MIERTAAAPVRTTPSLYLLGAASGLSPFGVTIAVPVLAGIAHRYEASMGEAQYVVSAYLFGLAMAQPFNGFLCDRFGRRPVLLTGFTVFVLASLAAAFAGSMAELIAWRFAQAAGVSVGTVASRAVVRDTQDAEGAAVCLAYIAAAMGFAPILAPIVGGYLGSTGGHAAVFLTTAALGVVIAGWAWLALPETLQPGRARAHWRQWANSYKRLFSSGTFLGYTLVFGFVQGCFFAFLAVGAAVFHDAFGIGEGQFGLIWGLMALSYVAGAFLNGRLVHSFGLDVVMKHSIALVVVGGWLAWALVHYAGLNLFTLLLPMGILMSVAGSVSPGALAGAVNVFPEMAGTSSGLSSALGIVVGGLFTVAGGYVYGGDYEAVTVLIAFSASMTGLSWLLVRSGHRRAVQDSAVHK